MICSETSIYHYQMYRLSSPIVQFLWSLNKSYLKYASASIVFPCPPFHLRIPYERAEMRFHYAVLHLANINSSNISRICVVYNSL
jgi:hypothetical protein